MKKTVWIVAGALLALSLCRLPARAADPPQIAPQAAPQAPPAQVKEPFDHSPHKDKKCVDCHERDGKLKK